MTDKAEQFARHVLYGSSYGCLNLNRPDIRAIVGEYGSKLGSARSDPSMELGGKHLLNIEMAMLGLIEALAAAEARGRQAWQPIETLPEGEHVLLWFPYGEKGVGGVEAATVYLSDGRYSYWTHGGANSGSDWEPRNNEAPARWMRVPAKAVDNAHETKE